MIKKTTFISLFVTSSLFANIEFLNLDSNFTRVNPSEENGVVLSYNSSIQDAKKSVVNVATKTTIKSHQNMGGMNDFFNDPFFEQFFGFKFGIPEEKLPHNLERTGNTSSASVPVLLDEMNKKGKLKEGDTLIFSTFGSGFTSGACIIKW